MEEFMGRQKMVSTSKLSEIIDLMKAKGVAKLSIPDTVDIELYAFAVDIGATPQTTLDYPELSSENEMNDQDLLLHSAR